MSARTWLSPYMLFAFAALAWPATACSASDSSADDLGEDPTADPAGAATTACVDACYAQHAGGRTAMTALDDCMVGACEPIEGSPTGGSCAAVGGGRAQVSYGEPEVDACIASACCAQAAACADDPECSALSACVSTCAGPTAAPSW